MHILGIETSADETAVALLDINGNDLGNLNFKIQGSAILSQITKHVPYGGIYPNLAKREHGRNLVPVLMETLRAASDLPHLSGSPDEKIIAEISVILERETELKEYLSEFLRSHAKPSVDAIAVTYGPGLEPALWVGINFAKALSLAWGIPIVGVNHMEGHLITGFLNPSLGNSNQIISSSTETYSLLPIISPVLALLVSGGHTELVLMREWMKYELLGETRDDAAGEAFDKCARLLGLPYPGGPEIAEFAREARASGLPRIAILPRPMHDSKDYDFSFSGLKTAVRNAVHEKTLSKDDVRAYAREIEDAIVEVLVKKTARAADEFGAHAVILGGGVSANTHLRIELTKRLSGTQVLFPPPGLSTDNAIMIALAGYFRAQMKEFADPVTLSAKGNLRLAD